MKKKNFMLLVCVAFLAILTLITGCEKKEECDHYFGEPFVTTKATCCTEGKCIVTCTRCGQQIEQSMPATGIHVDDDENGSCDYCSTRVPIYLTIKIDNVLQMYGEESKPLSYHIVEGKVLDGEKLNVTLTKEEGTDVGDYAITGTCDSADYIVTFRKGIYSIAEYEESSQGIQLSYEEESDSYVVTSAVDDIETVYIAKTHDDGVHGIKPVTKIADNVFDRHLLVNQITFPTTLIEIGKEAFFFCGNATTLTIPDSVETIGEGAFGYMTNLTELSIGKGLTVIPEDCFANTGLQNLEIPDNIVKIQAGAFSYCQDLEKVIMPDSIVCMTAKEKLGAFSFYSEDKLQYVTYGNGRYLPTKDNLYAYLIDLNEENESCVVHEKTLLIDPSVAMVLCVRDDPKKATPVYSFQTNWDKISIPASNPYLEIYIHCLIHIPTKTVLSGDGSACLPSDGLAIKIADYAFYGNKSLDIVTIPYRYRVIGKRAFANSSLRRISLPETIVSIGEEAFLDSNLPEE